MKALELEQHDDGAFDCEADALSHMTRVVAELCARVGAGKVDTLLVTWSLNDGSGKVHAHVIGDMPLAARMAIAQVENLAMIVDDAANDDGPTPDLPAPRLLQ